MGERGFDLVVRLYRANNFVNDCRSNYVWYTAMKYYIVIAIKINCFLCLYYLLVCLFLKVYNNSPVKVHSFVLYLQENNIFIIQFWHEMNKHWTQYIKSGKTFYEVFLFLLIWSTTAGMCLFFILMPLHLSFCLSLASFVHILNIRLQLV